MGQERHNLYVMVSLLIYVTINRMSMLLCCCNVIEFWIDLSRMSIYAILGDLIASGVATGMFAYIVFVARCKGSILSVGRHYL